jgi:homogentisate 1,2-dioxygenase
MKSFIRFPRVEGQASRQAHADLPPGTYERELGKEGFFGPATQMVHAHAPTGWTRWEGPLRPRAFDLTKLNDVAASPWEADEVLSNAHLRYRLWRTSGKVGYSDSQAWQSMTAFLQAQGQLAGPVDAAQSFSNAYLPS